MPHSRELGCRSLGVGGRSQLAAVMGERARPPFGELATSPGGEESAKETLCNFSIKSSSQLMIDAAVSR